MKTIWKNHGEAVPYYSQKNITMIRKIRTCIAPPNGGDYLAAKIMPPVFKTTLDAWRHFVRHPEDYVMYEDEVAAGKDVARAFGNSTSDQFDRMDELGESIRALATAKAEQKRSNRAAEPPAPRDGASGNEAREETEENVPNDDERSEEE